MKRKTPDLKDCWKLGALVFLMAVNYPFAELFNQQGPFLVGLFGTMFYLRGHSPSRRSSFAGAGHSPPLLFRRQRGLCERLDAGGLILGV